MAADPVGVAVVRAAEEGLGGLSLAWRHSCPRGMQPGILVAVEGVDGSGVTTLSKILVGALARLGLRAVYTKEPTRGPLGAIIREELRRSDADARLLALLFAADRLWHLTRMPDLPGTGILGALSRGYVVVTDRYKYTSLAYQGRLTGREWVWSVNRYAPPAHVLVYVSVDPETALERVRRRGGVEEAYHDPKRLKANLEAYESLISDLRRRPEYGPGRKPGAWSSLLEERGIPPDCLYPTPPAYPVIVVADNRGPLEGAAAQALTGLARALVDMGLAVTGGSARLNSRLSLPTGQPPHAHSHDHRP